MHSTFFDAVMWVFSSKTIWIPMYAYFLYLLIKQYKKHSWIIILAIIISVSLADSLSVALFKNVFLRLRPSHNLALEGIIHLVKNYRGGSYGFISSHAANTFALAVTLAHFLKLRFRYFPIFIYVWATLVCYSRIYLGVHYPGDVICGGLFGGIVAFIILKAYDHWGTKVFVDNN
ncbi:MAG: phosphatase PAP2 family protein [Bacteroidetes bacterium]|nr:phosphatase PAP2 family protein [Bacteroidota bacterium]